MLLTSWNCHIFLTLQGTSIVLMEFVHNYWDNNWKCFSGKALSLSGHGTYEFKDSYKYNVLVPNQTMPKNINVKSHLNFLFGVCVKPGISWTVLLYCSTFLVRTVVNFLQPLPGSWRRECHCQLRIPNRWIVLLSCYVDHPQCGSSDL